MARRLRPGRGVAVLALVAGAAMGPRPDCGGGSRPVESSDLVVSSEGASTSAPVAPPREPAPLPGFPLEPTPIPGLQTSDEAEAQDLALVAAAEGWTIEQAAEHRRASDELDDITEQVAAARPGTYVGAAVPAEPGAPSTLYIKGPADRTVRDLVAKAPVPITVVDNQPFSLDELEQRQLVVHRALADRGFKNFSVGFSLTGEIDASVTREPGLPDDPAVLVDELPSAVRGQVRLTVSDEPVARFQHAYGGMFVRAGGVNRCMSGGPSAPSPQGRQASRPPVTATASTRSWSPELPPGAPPISRSIWAVGVMPSG